MMISEQLYYIQNIGFSGNCLKWWAVDGKGYTLDLDRAWKVPEAKAKVICHCRPDQDIMWPVDQIDAITERHLNFEALTLEQRRRIYEPRETFPQPATRSPQPDSASPQPDSRKP